MAVSRRMFLHHGILAAACAALPLPGWSQKKTVTGEVNAPGTLPSPNQVALGGAQTFDANAALARLDRDAFAAAVGSTFEVQVTPGAMPVWMRLLAVTDLPKPAAPDASAFATRNMQVQIVPTAGFMLQFSTTEPNALAQGTYGFTHPALGQFAMFIVPSAGIQG